MCYYGKATHGCVGHRTYFRYKITLSVERNGRFYSASSVIEASQRPTDFLAYFMAKSSIPNFHAKGGVPIVKLGSHGYVFIPFAYWPNYASLPWQLYRQPFKLTDGELVMYLPKHTPPQTIRFGDPLAKKLGKVTYVPPGADGPRRAQTYEINDRVQFPGFNLNAIKVEQTTDETNGLVKNPPPWVEALRQTEKSNRSPPGYRFSRRSIETN